MLRAAQGGKIEAKELEKCIAGLNLLVANQPDEVEICKEEIEERLQTVMSSFKTKDRGVFVQASTLGSLEALLAFLKDSKIPVSNSSIIQLRLMLWIINQEKIIRFLRHYNFVINRLQVLKLVQ